MTDNNAARASSEPLIKRMLKRIINKIVDYSVYRTPLYSIEAAVRHIGQGVQTAGAADADIQEKLGHIGQHLQVIDESGIDIRENLRQTGKQLQVVGQVVGESRADVIQRIRQMDERLRYVDVHVQRINQRLIDIVAASPAFQFPSPNVRVDTDYPVALASDDHKFPRGAAFDDTRYPRFCLKAEKILGNTIKLLDIGCSGGGVVFDFLKRGHFAIGLEGSDFCLLNQRGHWSIIPEHLFTCDATKPYVVRSAAGNAAIRFDLISAWEVLEHIHEDHFEYFFGNIRNHLRPGGLFVASVATFEDLDPATGAVWHVTVKPREWWEDRMRHFGLAPVTTAFVTHDFPRGSGNPLATDWDAQAHPHLGFHIVAEAV